LNTFPKEFKAIKALSTLAKGALPSAMLISGEDEYLRRLFLSRLREIFLQDGGEFELIDATETDLASWMDGICNLSMFSSKRMSVIINAEKIKIDKDKKGFEALLKEKDSDRLTVFVAEKLDGRTTLSKVLSTLPKLDAGYLKPYELRSLAVDYFREKGIRISDELLDKIIFEVGEDLGTLVSELDRLVLMISPKKHLDKGLMEEINPNFQASIFDLIGAIRERKVSYAWELLENIDLYRGLKDETAVILTNLYKDIIKVFTVKACLSNRMSHQEIANRLNIKEYFLKSYISAAKIWQYDELKNACILISELDKETKFLNIPHIAMWRHFLISVNLERQAS